MLFERDKAADPKAEKNISAIPLTLDLCGTWSFAYTQDNPVQGITGMEQAQHAGLCFHEAQVPGNLELDLERNGLLNDPFYGMNTTQLRELEFVHVWYVRRFRVDSIPDCRAELVFEGIDCCASIFLNGALLGEVDNMLVEHIFDVTGQLCQENELLVHVRPALLAAKDYPYPANVATFATGYESLYVRKAPHMYGWDIMPRAVSAGLWRPVSLRFRPVERIKALYLETSHLSSDRKRAELRLTYVAATQGSATDEYRLCLEGSCHHSSFSETVKLFFDAGSHRFSLDAPQLWWPNGYGAPDLYKVHATLLKNGEELDRHEFNFGIRSVRLERTSTTTADGQGEFCFYLNGERVFAKGSNWVPLDAFHSRDLERTEPVIDLAVQAHCNILRCWGGNVYESDRFFDLCDVKGLMIWQDFAMGCAVYPQDEEFSRRIADESRKVIRRLRQHPSLILWAGDNECDLAYGWHGQGDPNRNVLTRKILPEILRQEDPHRPYLPSSPYVDDVAFKTGEDYIPEYHIWGPRGYYKAEYYQKALCHFASEIGYHGCPSPESVRQFISPEHVWPYQNNPEWNLHSTAPVPGVSFTREENYRVELMANQIRELFGKVPDNLDDFSFASQATQAEAKKTFIEMFRAGKWRRTGIIWWNLMDGWPQFSDAVVDYYFRKKLAYDVITRSQQHLGLMLEEPVGCAQRLVASNDTLQSHLLDYKITDLESEKELVCGEAVALANQATPLAVIPYDPESQRFYLIEWKSELGEGRNHYLAGKPPFQLRQYREWLRKAGFLP